MSNSKTNMLEHKFDKQIIKALGREQLSATRISQRAKLGRTSVQYRLGKLLNSRLVSRLTLNKRKILYRVNKKAVNELKNTRIIEIFTGKQMVQGYEYFLQLPRYSFILGVQGLGAVQKIFKVLPTDFIKRAHAIQKRRNIIIKGFTNKKALSVFDGAETAMIKSHHGRTVGAKVVDGNIFLSSSEILSSENLLLVSNLAQKRVVVIKDEK